MNAPSAAVSSDAPSAGIGSDAPSAAMLVVQRQLDAYNARDIEAFMANWSEDCRYFGFPDTLLADGRAAIRARHVERFREPDLHGRLLSRIEVGGLVVDHERVTRTFPDGPGEVEVIALYEVEDGLIVRAWFRTGTPYLQPVPTPSRSGQSTISVDNPVGDAPIDPQGGRPGTRLDRAR